MILRLFANLATHVIRSEDGIRGGKHYVSHIIGAKYADEAPDECGVLLAVCAKGFISGKRSRSLVQSDFTALSQAFVTAPGNEQNFRKEAGIDLT